MLFFSEIISLNSFQPKEYNCNNIQARNNVREIEARGLRVESGSVSNRNDSIEIIFLDTTKAYKCYGCLGYIRENGAAEPPPSPHNVILKKMMIRSYRKNLVVRFSLVPEPCYFHLSRACIQKKELELKQSNVTASEATIARLTDTHRDFIERQFSVIV